jgi:3-dehydroquinate synthase
MIQKPIQLEYQHRVVFTHGAFDAANATLRDLVADAADLRGPAKVLVFVDAGLLAVDAGLEQRIKKYFGRHSSVAELVSAPVVLAGGEACKNEWALVDKIWQAINFHKICRHSYVIAVGGGAFQDLVGFGAATAHRGIRMIRMPTTTLSQGDGGVGVKNGVNYFGKKNWVGTFSVPFAVVNDLNFLHELPVRERRAGIVEAIKVALIRDAAFFEYIAEHSDELAQLDEEVLEKIIRRSAELHVDHIATGGDPFELGSARPLDFGHWAAHKLEPLSDFAVNHGEAVAIGMAIDLLYAAEIEMLNAATANRILDLMEAIGFTLWSDFLDAQDGDGSVTKPVILQGLEEFREHLGGELTITLVPEVGRKVEVHEMNEAAVLTAVSNLRRRVKGATQSLSDQGTRKAPATTQSS